MTEPKFTKGPWVKKEMGKVFAVSDDRIVAFAAASRMDFADVTTGDGEALSNASLIAAAPDLYEALKTARSQLVTLGGDPRKFIAEDGSIEGDAIQAAVLDVIDAALAKADGGGE